MEISDRVAGGVLKTYRGLRLGMVVLVVFLAAAILIARLSATCLQSTISDYYFTTAHPVFIGAICALGTCLIIYQGSSATEDALLNFAGFLAFIVALVPTARPRLCGAGLPPQYDAAIGESVTALLIGAVTALVIYLGLRAASRSRDRQLASHASGGWCERAQACLPWVLGGLLLAGAADFFADRAQFAQHAHWWSAVAMFAAIICVVVINAIFASQRTEGGRRRRIAFTAAYVVLAAVMLIALVAAVIVHALYGPEWARGGVFVLESTLLLGFLSYWAVQTADLWNVPDYRCVLPAEPKVAIR
ncbi:MAG TPA: diphosphate--fructose-6-phosphate 1-phosphotransferase [Mycobacterium sp.]|nr:diphosphate--fructose-6-phosphate 1-phosphotransferase [Mycobacterium sp.]